jgi:hypothetical protein
LPWSRFHTLVIVALGITWVLDGLEVTLAGAVSSAKSQPIVAAQRCPGRTFGERISAGAVLGALLFGWLTTVSDASAFSS